MIQTPVIIVSGPKFSGKSRFIESILPSLRDNMLNPAGFFQRGVFDSDGNKIGHDLVNIAGDSPVPLTRRADTRRGWIFYEEAFEKAAETFYPWADLFVLDEVGPLEFSGGGHAGLLRQVLQTDIASIIVVRDELADGLAELVPENRQRYVLNYAPGAEDSLSGQILSILIGP